MSRDRHVLNDGAAEIEAGDLLQEREVLNDERTVETERPAHRVDIGLGRRFGDEQVGRITGQPLEEEDQRHDTEDCADNLAEPPEKKASHG